MKKDIQVIPGHQVDRDKWDRCVSSAANGMIYAQSDYLDHMTDHWTAIVVNDYETVMPVPWRKKWGVRYTYSVPFVQQLGIFPGGGNKLCEELLKVLFSSYRYGDYPFNWGNPIYEIGTQATAGETSADDKHFKEGLITSANGFTTRMRSNYILLLDRPYANLEEIFSPNARQNIRRSQQYGYEYKEAAIEEAVSIYQELYGVRMRLTRQQFSDFADFCRLLKKKDNVLTRKAVDASGRPQAICMLLKDYHRLYNIMPSTLPEGRLKRANYFLLSEIWKEYAGSGYIFDFEGSDLPGVKEFYRKFGAIRQPYPDIHFNSLPILIRWLKK